MDPSLEFDSVFAELQSPDSEVQMRSALLLKVLMFDNSASGDQFNSLLSQPYIYNRIHGIMASKDNQKKIELFYRIKSLIDLVGSSELETSRIGRVLDQMMLVDQIADKVADLIGYLCRPGWTLYTTYFDYTLGNCVEGLGSKSDQRKRNGLLILISFATHNPGSIYPKVDRIFHELKLTLKDSNAAIRVQSADLMEKCLSVILNREGHISSARFNSFYKEALENTRSGAPELAHSGLLVFETLLKTVLAAKAQKLGGHPDSVPLEELHDKIESMYDRCWQLKSSRSSSVRKEAMKIVPLVVKYDSKAFLVNHLAALTTFYLARLKSDKDHDRIAILHMFGDLCEVSAGTNTVFAKELMSFVASILKALGGESVGQLESGLSSFSPFGAVPTQYVSAAGSSSSSSATAVASSANASGVSAAAINRADSAHETLEKTTVIIGVSEYKGQKRHELEKALFYALTKLSQSLGSKIASLLSSGLIDLVISECNITSHFTELMSTWVQYYPSLEPRILAKLLDKVSLVLGGTKFVEPGVSVISLNLSNHDRKKLTQNNVIGAHFEEQNGKLRLLGPATDDVVGTWSKGAELRRILASHKAPYSTSSAPLANHSLREMSSGLNSFTAIHESHVRPNHTGDNSSAATGTHYVSIKDLADLQKAASYRDSAARSYGFMASTGPVGATSQGVLSAFARFIDGRAPNNNDVSHDTIEYQDLAMLIESLEILTKFPFHKYVSLFEFSRYVTLAYCEHSSADVRALAAKVTASLFAQDEIVQRIQIGSITAASHVLSRLLLLGVTDTSEKVRLQVMRSLSQGFDPQLAQSDNVKLLMMASNDGDLAVRKAAIVLLGIVSNKNPAYVIPGLRKILLQFLNSLKYGTTASSQEMSCSLLTCLLGCARILTEPHANAVMEVLIPLLKEHRGSQLVGGAAVVCIGEVARVSGDAASKYLDEVVPLILDVLKDKSAIVSKSQKIGAVQALVQLVRSSGKVVDPYFMFPELLSEIVKIVVTPGVDPELKKATIKLQGVLGALDPYKARQLEAGQVGKTKTSQQQKAAAIANNKPDYSNVSEIAKKWGHDEIGADFERGVDINEMLGNTDTGSRIPKTIQVETPADLLLLMQLNVDIRPSNVVEDYYLIVVLYMLVRLLNDSSASAHHMAALSIIQTLFKRLRDKCLDYTKLVIVGIIRSIRGYNGAKMVNPFNVLKELVKEVGKYVRPAVPELLGMVTDVFNSADKGSLISLVEQIALSMDSEFKLYVHLILPTFLKALNGEEALAKKIIGAFVTFGNSIEEHSQLVVSSILAIVDSQASEELRKAAIDGIGRMCGFLNVSDMSSRIVHSLLGVLAKPVSKLHGAAVIALVALMSQVGADFFIFVPSIDVVLSSKQFIAHPHDPAKDAKQQYQHEVHRLIENETIVFPYSAEQRDIVAYQEELSMKAVDATRLQSEWRPFGCQTSADWVEWLKNLNIKMLEASPSLSLSLCSGLAKVHSGVGRELFNSGFAAVWLSLSHVHQADLGTCLGYALQNAPSEVVPVLLNLAEFMEHNNTSLPVPGALLSKQSLRHHAFAKALHYKERDFKDAANSPLQQIDGLININNLLQQTDAGHGLLKVATSVYKLEPKESWFQKLQKWQEAKGLYEKKLADGATDIDVINGKMSCLHALGEWQELEQFTETNWNSISGVSKEKVAPLAAAAAWGTSQWDKMDEYIGRMKPDSANKYFFSAILAVHRCHYDAAMVDIAKARNVLGDEITPLVNESYGRAYDVVVRLQMLSDLEEIIEYKNLDIASPRKEVLRATWDRRLFACQNNVDIWQRLLNVRSLVVPPENDLVARIKFANLCRKSSRFSLAEQTLAGLKSSHVDLKPVPENQHRGGRFTNPALVYAQLKLLWDHGSREKAFMTMCSFTYDLSGALCLGADALVKDTPEVLPCDHDTYVELRRILCKCFLKQGVWQMELQPEWASDPSAEKSVLGSFLIPSILHDKWYKGHHYWAMANFEILNAASNRLRSRNPELGDKADVLDPETDSVEANQVNLHAVPACHGFLQSIVSSPNMALQDLLRLLAVWFAYSDFEKVSKEVEDGISYLSIETWLPVLPQLFSRLHLRIPNLNNALQKLLTKLGEFHPHALLFPLNVSSQSDREKAVSTAERIIRNIAHIHKTLVDEAAAAVVQMIKVALLLNERWVNAIERSVQLYHDGHFLTKIVKTFEEVMSLPRDSFHDKTFWALWGAEANRGFDYIVRYSNKLKETGVSDTLLLQSAFNRFAPLHAKLSAEFNSIKVLFLEYVAPGLLEMKDLQLSVPGTYEPGRTIIGIHRFENKVPIVGSKQRPRRFFIYGRDGKLYDYLLKGQEDIRQDNMVMQLFDLVNRLLDNDPDCFERHLGLEQYPTIPLSPKSGLIGWVPNSDTFNTLISQNRVFKAFQKDIERRAFAHMAGKHYEFSTYLRRIEVYLASIATSDGMDIYDILWLKSRSSETWLERRTGYVRSLALTSVVGYILGLGDRHPSNIMIHRISGKVIHIDYGDCFESASLREKWPEQVPFRLTRMLVNALEASGIEGSYKISFAHVLRVIRHNKDYLMALFDSFARDPLIKWGFDIPNKAVMKKTNYKSLVIPPEEMAKLSEIEIQNRYDAEEKSLMDARAQYVLDRISSKLTGSDFSGVTNMPIDEQVDRLIAQATDQEALAMHFIGWCAFW